jgi:bifunctional DNase/RNase
MILRTPNNALQAENERTQDSDTPKTKNNSPTTPTPTSSPRFNQQAPISNKASIVQQLPIYCSPQSTTLAICLPPTMQYPHSPYTKRMVLQVAHHRHGLLPVSGRIFLVLIFIQLNAFLLHLAHLPDKTAPDQNEPASVYLYPTPLPQEEPMPMSRMSFTKQMTFNGECRSSKLRNETWGLSVAPLVDKIDAKVLVKDMGTSIKTVPTIAVYDINNITNFTANAMAQLPNSVIKATQYTGYASRILDHDYFCFKCLGNPKKHLRMDGDGSNLLYAHAKALKNMRYTLDNIPFERQAVFEPQYKYLPRRIIIEEYLPMETMREYHWWTVNGQPVFICLRCNQGDRMLGSYFSASFRELEIGTMDKCEETPKPKTWDRMLSIVKKMGEHIPGIVCIDVYANDQDVYFSEFTFTRGGCHTFFEPIVADALLYSMSNGLIESHLVTSDYVEKTIADRSWVHVSFEPEEPRLQAKQGIIASGHPSSLDLCQNQKVESVAKCTRKTKPVAHFHLHCVVTTNNEISATIGQWKTRTVNLILARIDWRWALGIAALCFYLKIRANGAKAERKYGQVWNCFIYLAFMVVYKSQQVSSAGLLAPTPLWNTFIQSYEIFKIVHPVTSPAIAFSHFGTYWLSIAAFRARSLRAMLSWWLCFEIITAFVNEFFHYGEDDDSVRCMRVAFIQHAKQYAINDVIRVYLLPPFFVYGYLLPKIMLHWCGFL